MPIEVCAFVSCRRVSCIGFLSSLWSPRADGITVRLSELLDNDSIFGAHLFN